MKKQVILITEGYRPNYLYVCLAALKRCALLENWDLVISVDGPPKETEYADCKNVLDANWIFRETQLGNCQHIVTAINDVVWKGYESVFYLDADMILRKDALEYLARTPARSFFTSLYYSGFRKANAYVPMGNRIKAKHWPALYQFVQDKAWAGLKSGREVEIPAEWNAHDDIFDIFCRSKKESTTYADRQYTLHFGARGLNGADAEQAELLMFQGEKEKWLENVVESYRRGQSKAFCPSWFVYV